MTETQNDYEILLSKLRAARDVDLDGSAPAIKGPGHALAAVVDYLEIIGVSHELYSPLFKLNMAIDDHLRGKPNMLLTTVEAPGHRPPESIQHEAIKGYAAAGMTLLMEAGMTKKEAASRVVRSIKSWGNDLEEVLFTPHGASEPWKTVANWRDRIKREDKQKNYAASVYYMALESSKKVDVGAQTRAEAFLSARPGAII